MSQWMVAKVCLHHTAIGNIVWLILRTCNLIDNHLFLRLKIAFFQTWVDHITEKFDGTVQVLAKHASIEDRCFMRSEGIDFSPNVVKCQGDFLPIESSGAFKNHVL